MNKNKEILLNCIDSYNKCTMDWLNTFYSKNLEWIEMPTQRNPRGRKGGFNELKQYASNALAFFTDRKLNVIRSFVDENTVILEQEFSATLPQDVGDMKKGEITKQVVVSIFVVEEGLIIKQTDYIVPIMEK